MTPTSNNTALWFAFAGRALLSTDANQLRELLAELAASPAPNEDFQHLTAALTDSLPDNPTTLEAEYVRLFFNPQGSPCLLWQSAHHEDVRLMGESHTTALAWFRHAGLEPAAENQPADHAGLLLSFYARLLDHDASPADRERFYHDHLSWLPLLCDQIDAHTRLPFFRNLSHLIRLLVETEKPTPR